MDQGLRDQNSETTDLSPADQNTFHSASWKRLLQIRLLQKYPSMGAQRKAPRKWKWVCFRSKTQWSKITPSIQNPIQKRLSKPTMKLIENRLQSDSLKLEKIWGRTSQAISKPKQTPDSVEALRKAVGDLRSSFSDYELAWISLMDFTVHASLLEHQEERQTVEAMMRTRKELVQAAINEGLDRKNDLLLELGSFRSGSRASKSSVSSNAVQAHAKGEAATALKKAEMQRKISEFQTKSALALEQEERKR